MKKPFIVSTVLLTALSSCTRIDAGHEGILIKQYGSDKGVQDVSLVTGRVWYNPWTEDVDQYATYVQTKDYDPFTINAKGGSEFTVDPTLSFYIIPTNSPKIYSKYRLGLEDITNTVIYNHVKDAFRNQMNKYTTDEIISNRELFESNVQKTLFDVLEKEGFKLEQLTAGIKYPQTIVDAVNEKEKSVQDAMKSRNQLVRDSIEAQRKLIIATADKKVNDLKQASLTPLLIQEKFIDKWDGHSSLYGTAPTFFKNVQ